MSEQTIRLTQYSHGAGCGCKISKAQNHSEERSGEVYRPEPAGGE
jgi:selenophosphate synthase